MLEGMTVTTFEVAAFDPEPAERRKDVPAIKGKVVPYVPASLEFQDEAGTETLNGTESNGRIVRSKSDWPMLALDQPTARTVHCSRVVGTSNCKHCTNRCPVNRSRTARVSMGLSEKYW